MNISAVGSHFTDECKIVGRKIYDKGFSNVLNDLVTTGDGIEKISRLAVWILSVAASSTQVMTLAAERVLGDAREFLCTLLFFRSLAEITNQKEKLSPYRMTSAVLMAIGTATEFVHFTLRTQILQTTLFNKWSTELGQYSIFQLPVLSHLKTQPSQFFLFLASLTNSLEIVYRRYNQNQKHSSLKDYFHMQDVLSHIGNGGKMFLIFFNQFPHSTHYFKIVDGVVQVAGLLQHLIRA